MGPGPSATPEPPHPVPKEQQRPLVKDPHPLGRLNKEPHPLPRAPPTPIETFVVPQKERALSLTKPTKDLYNVKDKLKSPPGNMFKSYHSYESPTKSPAKRSESGLQYHHLSVDSFKQDAKSKVRRRKTSSSDRARAEGVRTEGERVRNISEGERARNISEHDKALAAVSPTDKVSPVKKADDPEVAEAAMLIVQFTQAFQKKHPDQEEKPETTSPIYPATTMTYPATTSTYPATTPTYSATTPTYSATTPTYPLSSSAYPPSSAPSTSYSAPAPKVEHTAALKHDPPPQSNHGPVSHAAPSYKKPTPMSAHHPPTSSYAPSNHLPSRLPSPSFNHKKEPATMNGPTLKKSPSSDCPPASKTPTSNHAQTSNHAPTSNHALSKGSNPSYNHAPSKSSSSSKPYSIKSEATTRKHPAHNDAPAKIPKLNNHHSEPKENTKMPVVTKTKHESQNHSEQLSKVPKLEREGVREEYKTSEVRKTSENHERRGEECKKVPKKEKEETHSGKKEKEETHSGKEDKERDFKQERDHKKERDQKKERDSKKFIPPDGAPALRPNPSKPNVAAHPPLLSQPLLSPRTTGLPPLKTPRHLDYVGRDVPCQPPVMRMAPTHKKHRDNTKIQVKVAHKPSSSKHPSTKSPHPSSKSPHPPSKSPLPINKSPHPSNKSNNLHPSTKSPHPLAKSSPAHTPPPPPPPPPPTPVMEENTSSPELVIEEGAASPQTIKASPDSSNLDIMSGSLY